jgi:hypothetical protein
MMSIHSSQFVVLSFKDSIHEMKKQAGNRRCQPDAEMSSSYRSTENAPAGRLKKPNFIDNFLVVCYPNI